MQWAHLVLSNYSKRLLLLLYIYNIEAICNTSDRSFTAYEFFMILIIALLLRIN